MSFRTKYRGKISLWIPISLIAILGIIFSISLSLHLRNISTEDLVQKFQRSASERSNLIITNLNNYLNDLEAVQRFYDGSQFVTRQEFKTFVSPIIRDKGFQAIEWLPRIKADQRENIEKSVRKEGYKDFSFTELDSAGKIVTAKNREEYFPVLYLEPFLGNENAFGYAPPSSNPARGKSLNMACDMNQPMASERIILVQEKERHFAFLVVLPIYHGTGFIPETVEKRRQLLQGFVQGVLRPVDILDKALAQISRADIAIRMIDMTAQGDKQQLYFLKTEEFSLNDNINSNLSFSQVFEFCGRSYKIECYPENSFISNNLEKSYITVPLLSGTFFLFIVVYLSTLVYQRRKMEDLVEIRTRELKGSEERFRTLIQNSNDIFSIIDGDGNIHLISPSVERITGLLPEELLGKTIFDYMYNDDIVTVKKVLHDIFNTPFQLFTVQFRYHKKDGGICYLEAVSQNLFEVEGVKGIVVNVRDITERKQFEEELISSKIKAEEMNRVKSSFFANMSHELRTPMHGILGISQILEESIENPKMKRLVEMLSQSGKRLLNTLNMILNLSRVEANKLDINLVYINICDVIKENIRLYELGANQKDLKLIYNSEYENLVIKTDMQMLNSVLNNMIDNAIKYTNEGSIAVSAGIQKIDGMTWAFIKVKDTGIGISEENQKIIFDEFRQASEGYSRSFEGTGLGLSIIKKYIELLNGKISVESRLGEGSTFSVYLPAVNIEESEQQKIEKTGDIKTDVTEKRYPGLLNILLVD